MQRVAEHLKTMYPHMESTQLAAIHHYTKSGGNYRQLNRQLVNGTLSDFNTAAGTLIAEGLQQLPKVEGVVYRGTIMKRTAYEQLYVGKDEIRRACFTSASMNTETAARFASSGGMNRSEVSIYFKIQSKNGRDISKISEFNGIFDPENQHEVLFVDGTKFRIAEHESDRQNVYITLVEL
jgi:hypothetical protein